MEAGRSRGAAGLAALLAVVLAMTACGPTEEQQRPGGAGPEGPLEALLHSHDGLQGVLEEAHSSTRPSATWSR